MMKEDDFIKDDFLRDLIRRRPLDGPSEDFVERVMSGIQSSPETAVSVKPFYLYMKAAMPFVLLALVLLFVAVTSDLPVFNWLPGKDYFMNSLLPYIGNLLSIFKTAFASKYVSWALLISFSAGVLFVIDRIFSRRGSFGL